MAENTLLTPRIPVYDLVSEEIIHGHIPPNRRAFTRFVHSDVGNHPLFEGGGALKPAVVGLSIEESTQIAAEKEDLLRKGFPDVRAQNNLRLVTRNTTIYCGNSWDPNLCN